MRGHSNTSAYSNARAAGQSGIAALARLPVAGRGVEENLAQTVLLEQRSQRGGRMLVRKKELDGRKTIVRGGAKAVEKVVLRVHRGQIGGKARHGNHSGYQLRVDRQMYGS